MKNIDLPIEKSVHELSHNTFNPLQVTLSSLNLLLHENITDGQKILVMEAIRSTRQIDELISTVFYKYFEDV